ncbi:hypothetical protein [Spirosoma validum]|uniref:Uncharacterized protein n=1 Tax=Spirosoma validum TaxID=2771355 RepID=A0A927B1U7_9BACT|nr:hypothetical protein [Spirosoma validum]MBD2753811.1 hypothetical protein [Spirosoma validum]
MSYRTDIDINKGYKHGFRFALGYRVRMYHQIFTRSVDAIEYTNYTDGIICGDEESNVSAKYHHWYFLIDRVVINGQICTHSWLNGKVSDFYDNSSGVVILSKKIQPILFGDTKNYSYK